MNSPFLLEKISGNTPANNDLYQRWRDNKLKNYPSQLSDLIVELKNTTDMSSAEHNAILDRCKQTNMAIYIGNTADNPAREIPHYIGQRFGLNNLNHNWLGDDDGLTSLTVADQEDKKRKNYIPYSNRPIKWHTDGYYNTADKQIHAVLLHCVKPAIEGGANALLDHEIAYILLREKNPDFIRLLMQDDVMTIPPRLNKDDEIVRKEEVGPIFSVDPLTGNLHMRYTIRTYNVIWKDDPETQAALTALSEILSSDSPYIFHGKLESGMGLICNNVLHDRTGFSDTDEQHRLIYRARYFDRMGGTDIADLDF